MSRKKARIPPVILGFTLIELLTVISIVAILMAIAGPNFTALIGQTRVRTLANDFQLALLTTRSEALSRGRRIHMAPVTGTDWSSGWIIFVDQDNDNRPDVEEEVIRRYDSVPDDIKFKPVGGNAFNHGNRAFISYTGTGFVQHVVGQTEDGVEFKNNFARRRVTVGLLGRPVVKACEAVSGTAC